MGSVVGLFGGNYRQTAEIQTEHPPASASLPTHPSVISWHPVSDSWMVGLSVEGLGG